MLGALQPASLLEIAGDPQIGQRFGGSRQLPGWESHPGPVVSTTPGAHEQAERLALGFIQSAVHNHLLGGQVITHHHGVMPLRIPIEGQVLHHQHRVAGVNFGQNGFEILVQRINQQVALSGCSDHFHLQSALALGQIDAVFQIIRGCRYVSVVEHHGQ